MSLELVDPDNMPEEYYVPNTVDNNLKFFIIEANNRYRVGKPIISDQKFDDLCEQYQSQVSPEEWEEFRNSLHEKPGKIKHPFVMGSLNKVKYEEPRSVWEFVNENCFKGLFVSKKIDGISCRLTYHDGILVSATTRGDGYYGEDITDKIKFVKYVPYELRSNYTEIDFKRCFSVRGELVILDKDFEELKKIDQKDDWKNPRNACAGLMNRKNSSEAELSKISFIAYSIIGQKYPKSAQINTLMAIGFKFVKYFILTKLAISEIMADVSGEKICKKLFELHKEETPYKCDGLVMSNLDYVNEDQYRPDGEVAFKVNELVGDSELLDVIWEGPSKTGKFVPIGVIKDLDLGGSTISKVMLNNMNFIEKFGLKIGSKVKISKSGDIIPKLIGAEETLGARQIFAPDVCSSCGSTLEQTRADLICPNAECRAKRCNQILDVITKFEINNVSIKTLEKWNIDSIDDILAFKANPLYKKETDFSLEITEKIFKKSELELFYRMSFNGLSRTLLEKIVEHYGWEKIRDLAKKSGSGLEIDLETLKSLPETNGYPPGIGKLIWDRFVDGLPKAMICVDKIKSDARYCGSEDCGSKSNQDTGEFLGYVCFSGTPKIGSKSRFYEFIEKHGYKRQHTVTKGLTYLVVRDMFKEDTGKIKKAKKLGITVIQEDFFRKMIGAIQGESHFANNQ